MIELKVLSGTHSGASLPLRSGRHRIASVKDAALLDESQGQSDKNHEILLYDWDESALLLEVTASNVVMKSRGDGGNDPQDESSEWKPLTPIKFGAVTLCYGPKGGSWPSEPALLAQMNGDRPREVAPVLEPCLVEEQRSSVRPGLIHFVLIGALAAALFMGYESQFEAAQTVMAPSKLKLSAVQEFLQSRGLSNLQARSQGDTVEIIGLVRDANEDDVLRQALAAFPQSDLRLRWSIATEVADTIDTALIGTGARTRYLGDGVFRIDGKVKKPQDVEARVTNLRADLGPVVKDLQVAVVSEGEASKFSSSLITDQITYVERARGVKSFPTHTLQ